MEKERLEILHKIVKGELTIEQADKQLLSLYSIIASDFLTSRKLVYGNTMRAIFNKYPEIGGIGIYFICEKFLHEGYMLAVRCLKKNRYNMYE